MNSRKISCIAGAAMAFGLSGCARTPSVDVFGSYFPVWMFCLGGGIALTLAIRFLLIRAKLDTELGPRALVYPSLAALFTCAIWLVGFHD